jgi:hypothetical protein
MIHQEQTQMRTMMTTAFALLCCPSLGWGQEASPAVEAGRRAAVESTLQVERARVGVESRITRGAPYSGEAIAETVQVLADGNRIVRKTTTRVYRDSEGRTRREQLSQAGEVISVTISDPVAESQYVLNPQAKTAHRNGVIMTTDRGGVAAASVSPGSSGTVVATRTPDGGARVEARDPEAERKREVEAKAAAVGTFTGGGRGGGMTVLYAPEVSMLRVPGESNVRKEELGQQIIEGVMASGSCSTTIIPAGAIGNAREIEIVSEQWFSDDLKVLVITRHSDPRSGETTYRLSNIVQGEPQRGLFEVPADYTLKDSVIRRESPLKP